MNKLGGLAQKMPHTTLSWLIGVGSMMGIPLMSGFASKWMLYAAALAGRLGRTRHGRLGRQPRHGLPRRQGHQRRLPRPADRGHQGRARIPAHHGLGHGPAGRGQRRSRHRAATGRQLPPESDPRRARHWARAFMSPGLASPPMRAASPPWAAWCWPWSRSFSAAPSTPSPMLRAKPRHRAVTAGGAAMAGAGGGIFTGGEPLSDQGPPHRGRLLRHLPPELA